MEPYTRWERRKEIVKLIYRLERKETPSPKEETIKSVFNPVDIGRNIVFFI
jgi:hypothetical protein